MRAASPSRQIESENEMIVISHRLFDWEKRFEGYSGACYSLIVCKRGGGFYRLRGFSGRGTAHFVIDLGEAATFIPHLSKAFIQGQRAARPEGLPLNLPTSSLEPQPRDIYNRG